MPSYEVFKKHGRGWSYKGLIQAVDSVKAAGQAGYIYGVGTYKVRPEDSQDKFFSYKVGVK